MVSGNMLLENNEPNMLVTQEQIQFAIWYLYLINWGMQWHSWLRHWATSQKVAGSIPNGVIGFFHWHNPSGRTTALGLTQPLTEMSTRNVSWG